MITVRIYDERITRQTGETQTNGEDTTPTTPGSGEYQVEYHSNMTVAGTLEAVSYIARKDVRVEVNGRKRKMDHRLSDGDTVTVTANIHNG